MDYYPFGSPFGEDSLSFNFLFQGKEYIVFSDYNSFDFHARQYDPFIGRFSSIDPRNQFASGYAGMGNMPTIGVDPDGEFWHIVAGAVIGGGVNLWRNWDAVANAEGGTWAKIGKGAAFFGLGAAEGAFIAAAPAAGFARVTATVAGRAVLSGAVKSVGNVLLGGNPDQINPVNIATDAVIAGLTAGTLSGISSSLKGGSFLWGKGSGYGGDLVLGGILDDAGNIIPSRMAGTVTKVTEVTANQLAKASSSTVGLLDDVAGQGYKSFNAFKAAQGRAGDGMAWHHIVEQHPDNIAKFGAETIHNTENLIKLPHGAGSLHNKITGYYNSKLPGMNMRVRDYVKTLSFEEQFNFGIETLKKFGWTPR